MILENLKTFPICVSRTIWNPRRPGWNSHNHTERLVPINMYPSIYRLRMLCVVQGPSYLLWHAEALSQLLEKMTAIAKKTVHRQCWQGQQSGLKKGSLMTKMVKTKMQSVDHISAINHRALCRRPCQAAAYHWGQPREATVVKMASTRPLASRSFCLLAPLCDHSSLSNLQQSNTRAWYTIQQNDRLVPFLVFVQ